MPTPGSKVCSESGWPMPRMKTLTVFDEPRPGTMLRLGTAPCRPLTSWACRSRSCSSPNALTATGTSWIDSARRRAVTVTPSRVVASTCCPPGVDVSCSCACAPSDAMPSTTATLRMLRFIDSLPTGLRMLRPAGRATAGPATLQAYGPVPASGTCTFGQCERPGWAGTLAAAFRWITVPMSLLIVHGALRFLMYVAYRGHSVILFAPVAAMGAVLLTDPDLVAPMLPALYMDRMVGFLKLYFPVFLLGAVFGKLIEISGFSKAIVAATIRLFGPQRAMLSIVTV